MVMGSRLIAVTLTSDFAPVSRNEMLNIQISKDWGFNLKLVRDMEKRTVKWIITKSTDISPQ